MNKDEALKRITKLRKEIARLREEYHVRNAPDVTDDVYDSLTRELKKILEEYPELDDPNAPEHRVAGRPLDKFTKVKHRNRMLSLNDVFSEEELFRWDKRIKKLLGPGKRSDLGEFLRSDLEEGLSYFCEVKFDGLAVSLIYEEGIFVRGATRGDGFVGEDITENLKTIHSIPLALASPFPKFIEVRGEAVMSKKTLSKLNLDNKKQGKPLFANTRNAAAGSLRQLDPRLAAQRHLDFFAYDIVEISLGRKPTGEADGEGVKTHSDKHKLLSRLGFQVDKNEAICKNLEEVNDFIEQFAKVRLRHPYGTDGVVVSMDDLKIQDMLGAVGKAPRYMVAYKYPAERATTVIKDVRINVGRTGVLTPLALFEPTIVAGSVIRKATLHNMDQIERLDLRIGDTAVVEKAGDVIPKVVEVLTRLRTGKEKKVKIPERCPACGGKVEKKTTGIAEQKKNSSAPLSVAYYCSNPKCPAKDERYLEHFVSVLEIYELGPKILRRFKDEGLITDAADIFTLEKADIALLPRFGEKSAENIVEEIKNKKKISLSRFLWALGILHVGEETARDLARRFGTLEKLMRASIEQIDEMENIGPAVSKSVYDFFQKKNNLNFIKKLEKNGVIVEKEKKKKTGKLTGLSFVLTGTLQAMSRDIAKERIIGEGGKVASSVSKNTSYVVSGAEPGSKFARAQKLGVKILSEKDFLKML